MPDGYSYSQIKENLRIICENVSESYDKYRNDDTKIDIMAVTKTVPAEVVNWVFDFGLDLLGENRVQEYQSKKDDYRKLSGFGTPPRIHFIGHLQTNKVKYIINDMDMIQSVDSLRLGQEIDRLARANDKVMDILCEVNIGGEDSKNGVSPGSLPELLEQLSELENIRIRGLMTIPPPSDSDIYLGRMGELFAGYKELYSMDTLSMGMTHDYAAAVRCGSTLIRIGTGLFGARDYSR
ncbi:MAG: YggS family pyridoxal phosphate-dependent enzyme [Ruminococcus sp.]|nr:YggS family pyridoxal phosphate-dependent enzyme [Ruminococcus sp.]